MQWVPNGRHEGAGGEEHLLRSIAVILSTGLCWEVGEQGKPCGDSIAIPKTSSCAQSKGVGDCWETGLFICGFSPPKSEDSLKSQKTQLVSSWEETNASA